MSHNQTLIAYFFFSFFLALHTLTTRFFDRMRGVDSALQFAVSYHNFVYFFCRQFMLNPDIIPELVVSGIFINFWGEWGEFDIIFFLHSLVCMFYNW